MLFCHDALMHRSALLRITSTDNYKKNRKSIRKSVGLDLGFLIQLCLCLVRQNVTY